MKHRVELKGGETDNLGIKSEEKVILNRKLFEFSFLFNLKKGSNANYRLEYVRSWEVSL